MSEKCCVCGEAVMDWNLAYSHGRPVHAQCKDKADECRLCAERRAEIEALKAEVERLRKDNARLLGRNLGSQARPRRAIDLPCIGCQAGSQEACRRCADEWHRKHARKDHQ
jgi:hypothetical protein